jgi:3-oxoacyl-[acyl-carrier protein] reductase
MEMNTVRLKDRAAFVTGAGAGIGRATALRFSAEGAAVAVVDINGDKARETANEINEAGGYAIALAVDVSDKPGVDGAVEETVRAFDRLDILLSSAGIVYRTPFLEVTPEDWNRVLGINLTGTLFCGQAAARVMVERNYGRIINITSVSGQRGGTNRCAYGASKAAVVNLTETMAVELAPYDILVNAIAPGPIQVERTAHGPKQREAMLTRLAIKRYGTPPEVASAALYLASEECGYVTGHVLNVDGGFRSSGVIFAPEAAP